MSFIIPPPFKIEFPEQLMLSDSIRGNRSGVAASEKAVGLVNNRIEHLPGPVTLSNAINGARSHVAASEKAVGLVNQRIPSLSNALTGTRSDVAASQKALGLVNRRIPELSLNINGTRTNAAASEKALGLVNKRIPQARLTRNGQGSIAYGSIGNGTGDMIQFETTRPKQWGIITLSIKTSIASFEGHRNILSLGLMSLNASQLTITDQSALMTLLLDESVTHLYGLDFEEDTVHERFMTLLVDSSVNKIVFFDCPFGVSVTFMQELVIQ